MVYVNDQVLFVLKKQVIQSVQREDYYCSHYYAHHYDYGYDCGYDYVHEKHHENP